MSTPFSTTGSAVPWAPRPPSHLADYFAFWERYWAERVPDTPWFRSRSEGVYLWGKNPLPYLQPLKDSELGDCQRSLEKARGPGADPRAATACAVVPARLPEPHKNRCVWPCIRAKDASKRYHVKRLSRAPAMDGRLERMIPYGPRRPRRRTS